MKRKLLQESLELSTEIHALINQVPEDKVSDDTEQVKTLSLAFQSHLVRAQKREAEELFETLEAALAAITELEEKMLENVKQRRLKKMAINPMLAKLKELEIEIKTLAGMRI
jgi:vacuolar-type H+-ATPase subunit B/Vma2